MANTTCKSKIKANKQTNTYFHKNMRISHNNQQSFCSSNCYIKSLWVREKAQIVFLFHKHAFMRSHLEINFRIGITRNFPSHSVTMMSNIWFAYRSKPQVSVSNAQASCITTFPTMDFPRGLFSYSPLTQLQQFQKNGISFILGSWIPTVIWNARY